MTKFQHNNLKERIQINSNILVVEMVFFLYKMDIIGRLNCDYRLDSERLEDDSKLQHMVNEKLIEHISV